ncbi:hypothetical protein CORC01_07513 [Colletotrichum orchidophilum]|uniref:Uncharacterized protein n=1 Tax=Colletotrichum orchidophilum TaxID=1209926 RepID=A0A1G4B734_9PEZI|nr:uncharacterized protein CORC01_07513 [Colletotrichum orchidophilum]OHE97259.1 hypothetical protein CORC01_07513 [Colletotrichum orchidophilum]
MSEKLHRQRKEREEGAAHTTPTPTHYYAYTRTSHHRSVPQRPVCYFCLPFVSQPPRPRVMGIESSSRYLYPKAETWPQPELQCARRRPNQIPVRQVAEYPGCNTSEGAVGEKHAERYLICHEEERAGLWRGAAHRASLRIKVHNSAVGGERACLAVPNLEPKCACAPFACPPSLGLLRRPRRLSLTVIFVHRVCPCKEYSAMGSKQHRQLAVSEGPSYL